MRKESRLVQMSRKTPNVASTTNTVDVKSSTHSISIGRHTGIRRKTSSHMVSRIQGGKRKSMVHDHGDSEVLSLSNSLTTLTSREIELEKIFGPRFRDVSDGNTSGKTETACVVDSGCSSIDSGKRKWAGDATDYSRSKRPYEGSSDLVRSTCSRELQGSSAVTDLCVSSCSDSILSGLRSSYKRYRSNEPAFIKKSTVTPCGRNSATADEILAEDGPCVAVEYMGKSFEDTSESSYAISAPAGSNRSSEQQQQQQNCSSAMDNKSTSDIGNPQGDGSYEQSSAPTFVLSSGRLSKEQEKKLGLRPSTIDDDFDQYFAQLML